MGFDFTLPCNFLHCPIILCWVNHPLVVTAA